MRDARVKVCRERECGLSVTGSGGRGWAWLDADAPSNASRV